MPDEIGDFNINIVKTMYVCDNYVKIVADGNFFVADANGLDFFIIFLRVQKATLFSADGFLQLPNIK